MTTLQILPDIVCTSYSCAIFSLSTRQVSFLYVYILEVIFVEGKLHSFSHRINTVNPEVDIYYR